VTSATDIADTFARVTRSPFHSISQATPFVKTLILLIVLFAKLALVFKKLVLVFRTVYQIVSELFVDLSAGFLCGDMKKDKPKN